MVSFIPESTCIKFKLWWKGHFVVHYDSVIADVVTATVQSLSQEKALDLHSVGRVPSHSLRQSREGGGHTNPCQKKISPYHHIDHLSTGQHCLGFSFIIEVKTHQIKTELSHTHKHDCTSAQNALFNLNTSDTGHKQGTDLFPLGKPLPRSTANSTDSMCNLNSRPFTRLEFIMLTHPPIRRYKSSVRDTASLKQPRNYECTFPFTRFDPLLIPTTNALSQWWRSKWQAPRTERRRGLKKKLPALQCG